MRNLYVVHVFAGLLMRVDQGAGQYATMEIYELMSMHELEVVRGPLPAHLPDEARYLRDKAVHEGPLYVTVHSA